MVFDCWILHLPLLLGFILSLIPLQIAREISLNGNGYLTIEYGVNLDSINIGFDFLTGNADATIIHLQSIDVNGNHIGISLRDSHLIIEIFLDHVSYFTNITGLFNDGKWHTMNIKERRNKISVVLDDSLSASIILKVPKSLKEFMFSYIRIAGKFPKDFYRYRGCIRNLISHSTDLLESVNNSMVMFEMVEMIWNCHKESFTSNWKIPFSLQSYKSAVSFKIKKSLTPLFILQFDFKVTRANFPLFRLANGRYNLSFNLLPSYVYIKSSNPPYQKKVPFSSYGHWNTIIVVISHFQMNVSINSHFVFIAKISLEDMSKFSLDIGSESRNIKFGKESALSDSAIGCIRNLFINYRPYALADAGFVIAVITGCSQIFGCLFSPCPFNGKCSYSFTNSVICHCSANLCLPNLQVIDSQFLPFTVPDLVILQYSTIASKPIPLFLHYNLTVFLSIYDTSSLIMSKLPIHSDIDLLTYQRDSQLKSLLTNRFTVEDVIKKRIFCCQFQFKQLSKSFSIYFVIYLNSSKAESLNFIPHQAILNGIYLEVRIKYFNATMRLPLKLPAGRIVLFDPPRIVVDDKIVLSDLQVNPYVIFNPFPTEHSCGEFIFTYNNSIETVSDKIPLKLKYETFLTRNVYFQTTKQCDFQIWAVKGNQTSKSFVLSLIPRSSLSINIRNTGISCSPFSKTFILPSHLLIRIPNVRSSKIVFLLSNSSIKNKNNIEVFNSETKTWKRSYMFSQSDINRGFVRYISDSDNTFWLQLTYTYVDLSILVHAKLVEKITLLVQMTKLEVKSFRNWDLILNMRSKRFVKLSQKYLNVAFEFEAYSLHALNSIWFSLKNVPFHGFISYGASGRKITRFSVAELKMGKIFYVCQKNIHNLFLLKEQLEFIVVYKSLKLSKGIWINVYIAYNDIPSDLILQKYPILTPNGTNFYKINAENLWISADNCHSFMFSILVHPKFGKFISNLKQFSKQDIIEGVLTYHRENLEIVEDRFIFHLTCKSGLSRVDFFDEFWMKFEERNNFPPEKNSLENIYVSYEISDILSPGLIRFNDRDSKGTFAYEVICNSNIFPPCPCHSDSGLIYHESGESRHSFTNVELGKFQIRFRNRGLISENLCFLIFDGRFNMISISNVNVDNLYGLVIPSYQRFAIYIRKNIKDSVFISIKCSFYLDSSLNNYYFVLTSLPEYGNLYSLLKKHLLRNDIISLQDILQMRMVYELKDGYRIDGVEDQVGFQMKNTMDNEFKEIKVVIVTEFIPYDQNNHLIETDCAPTTLKRFQVLFSNDLTQISERYLLSECRLINEKHQIVYNITKSPTHGLLQYRHNSFVINDIRRFSQMDLLMGRIHYNCRICKYRKSVADDDIGKFASDQGDEGFPNDQFSFQLETSMKASMREWRFDIEFTSVLVLMTNDGLLVYQNANQTLNNIKVKIYQNFYFHNRNLNFNISLTLLHFKIISNPKKGKIFSSKLGRPVQMFPYQDMKRNEILYLHQGNLSDLDDKFEIMAYLNPRVSQASSIISEPMTVKVLIKQKTRQIKLISLKQINSWARSKVAISNRHLYAIFDNDNCNNKVSKCVQDTDDIVYLVKSASNGFVTRINQSLLNVQSFTQQDINENLIYFIDTGNINIKRSGGFRFHVTLRGNREIFPIVGGKFIINFYPIKFSIHKEFDFQVSSISACQSISEKHLTTNIVQPNSGLPKMDIYYKLIRTPGHGTVNKKVFNKKSKRIHLRTIHKNGNFSQNDIRNKLICFIIFPGSDFGRFHDTVHLMILTDSRIIHRNNFISFELFIRPENINHFNQNIFFFGLSWVVMRNETLFLTVDRFRFKSFVENILHNNMFVLILKPCYGQLSFNGVPMKTGSVFFLNDIIQKHVAYRAFDANSIYPVTDTVEIQMSPNASYVKLKNKSQNIHLSFILISPSKNLSINFPCVKHSQKLLSLSLFENITAICAKLYFKITKGPNNGRMIVKSGSRRTIISEHPVLIRCSEIKSGLVYYRNISPNSDSDMVGLRIYHVDLLSYVHDISVAIKLMPFKVVITPKPIGILQCECFVMVSSNHIKIATNLLSERDDFYVSLDLLPLYGNIYLDHIPVSGFKYSHILEGRVLYVQSDMMRSTDRFDISLSLASRNQKISNSVSVGVTVVPRVKITTAVVMIGAKLIITSQHINSESLIRCSNSYVLFTIQNKFFHYGEMSKEKFPGDITFTNHDIQFQRLIYESFSFFHRENDDLIPRNPKSILMEEIVLAVSTPNSSVPVQPSVVTFRIQIIPKDYMKKHLKFSPGKNEKQEEIQKGIWITSYFSLPFLCLISLSVILVILLVVAVWYCVRYQNVNRAHLLYQLLSSFPGSGKKSDEPLRASVQSIEHSVPMFANRFFIDSGNENLQLEESSPLETKFNSPTITVGIEIERINIRPTSAINTIKICL